MVKERQKKRNGVYKKFIHSISSGGSRGAAWGKKKKEGGKNSL